MTLSVEACDETDTRSCVLFLCVQSFLNVVMVGWLGGSARVLDCLSRQ